MLPTHLEKIIFHNVLKNKELLDVVRGEFFDSPNYDKLYELSKKFINKYGQTPTLKQMYEIVKAKAPEIKLDFLKEFYNIDMDSYDEQWLKENVESWIEYKNLDKSVENLVTYLKTTKIDTGNIKDVVEKAKDIIVTQNNLDFGFDAGLDFFDPESHIQPTWDTFSTGFPYLDTVLGGGWATKSLYVISGMMKVGKSIWLANLCANAVRLGYNSALISCEMKDRHCVKRLGANLLGISMKEYADTATDQDLMKKKLQKMNTENGLGLIVPGKLYVKEYPASCASVKDIERWLLKMEEMKGIKFKTVFLDYINILMNWRNPNTENTYMKIKQIAEDLRAMATRNNWAVITLTQLNRAAEGSSHVALSNVAESSGLGHTVDWMGGIIQDELMYANNEYMLQTMLNRNEGFKNSKKKFHIDYDYMRLTESDEEMIQGD